MSTPPLLVAAAVLFWGWHTGLSVVAAPVALLLEGWRLVRSRLDLSRRDFDRVADLSMLLTLGAAIYLFGTAGAARTVAGAPRALAVLVQWLPLAALPLVACQAYSTAGRVDVSAFFWSQRRRVGPDGRSPLGTVDLGYPYVALCVLAASAAEVRSGVFYAGLCALAGWALWRARSPRISPAFWAAMLVVVASLGWAGQAGLRVLQARLERVVLEYMLARAGRDTDPFRSSTAIGRLGALKLSDRVLLRVDLPQGTRAPTLLREASYDVYRSPAWFATGAAFTSVQPEADGETWAFDRAEPPVETIAIAAYLDRGRGVLALPARAVRIDGLAVVGVGRNRLGAVKVDEGLGLVSYRAHAGRRGPLDGPPADTDLAVPPAEAPVLARIAHDLRLRERSPADAMAAVTAFLDRGFRYSVYQAERSSMETPLEDFLVRTRAGHCEYFATATVLLLRVAGVPARYAVGYSVQEWSWLERRWVVRARHAHAWALAWIDGAWRDVDTTPAVWAAEEAAAAAGLAGWLRDFWSWAVFLVSRWRWSEGAGGPARYVGWLLVPLVLLLIWRLTVTRRVARRPAVAPPVPAGSPGPGADSEFYLIEGRLTGRGLGRRPAEPVSAWLGRIAPDAAAPGALREIAALHYRYRFDPRGLDGPARAALRTGALTWLAADREDRAGADRAPFDGR